MPKLVSVMSAEHASKLLVSADESAEVCVLHVDGLLDGGTYRQLRDDIIKAALGAPRAVIVDISSLVVPASSALSVFTSARWHVCQWPDVPIMLVCAHRRGRTEITRNGVARYVPVYESVDAASAAVEQRRVVVRRRARVELPRETVSLRRSRELMAEWLKDWSRADLIAVAKLVVTVLVENVLAHTESAPTVRLESMGDVVTIAVEDESSTAASRRERSPWGGQDVSGLAIVAALCRAWGSLPTPSGKAVWATIGPENRL